MHSFHIISEEDGGLTFPDWASEDVTHFAARIKGRISLTNVQLSWDDINQIADFAKKELDAASHFMAPWYAARLKDELDLTAEEQYFYQLCSTAKGILLGEGPGLILSEWLQGAEIENGGIPLWSPIEAILPEKSVQCVLNIYALKCIDIALSDQITGNIQGAMGNIVMAADIVAMTAELFAWDSATTWERKKALEPRKKGARILHIETYALRAEVIEYWRTNINHDLSGPKAALILSKIFPLSHRKLSEYVNYEKKNTSC